MMKKSILATIRDYKALQRLGIRDAWQISGMSDIGDKIVGYVCAAIAVALACYALLDYRDAKAAEYTKALEETLAICLSDTYKPIKIGDEWFLCGINKI